MIPGVASGTMLPGHTAPALPYEHPRPGASRSISVTWAPRRSRCQAVQTPTMPAPTTTTASRPFLFSPGGCIAGSVRSRHADVSDQLRPLDELTRHSFGKFFRRAADRVGTFTRHAFTNLRRFEHVHDLAVDLGSHVLGGAGRRKDTLP